MILNNHNPILIILMNPCSNYLVPLSEFLRFNCYVSKKL